MLQGYSQESSMGGCMRAGNWEPFKSLSGVQTPDELGVRGRSHQKPETDDKTEK